MRQSKNCAFKVTPFDIKSSNSLKYFYISMTMGPTIKIGQTKSNLYISFCGITKNDNLAQFFHIFWL